MSSAIQKHPNYTFAWIELSSSDMVQARQFYSHLFGWQALEIPLPFGGYYTMFQQDGLNVAGGGPLQDDQLEAGIPSYWLCYLNVEEIEVAAERIGSVGGAVVMPPMQVMEEGWLALIQEPTGAMLGLWQAKNHIGVQVMNRPNTLCWVELQTRDPEAAKTFLSKAFDWQSRTDQHGYTVFYTSQGEDIAGMIPISPEWGEMPPSWVAYIMVADIADTVQRATELGGQVLVAPMPMGEMGLFALLQDPTGATVYVAQFNQPLSAE